MTRQARSAPGEPPWFDSHCHVTARDFDADREEVLERAWAAGVCELVAIGAGYGLEDNEAALELAARDPRIYATVGIHPHDARLLDDEGRRRLGAWLGHSRVVAVGETGLDYHYLHSPRETQRAVCAEQIALARERGLPVSIHVRGDGPEAYEELLEIWRSEAGGALEGVLHCYTHDLDFALRALDHGLLVSFSGILTFKNAEALREVARRLPLDRILVETDSPFLSPEGLRGRRNEPARVTRVGETLAQVRGTPLLEVARATTANARRLYRLSGED
ncbi:MAG: TatD family hydrolase [Myxococcota bacterium]